MGRRAINTTKSGKYMNPTDQASKFQEIQANNQNIFQNKFSNFFRKRSSQERTEEK